MKTSVTMVRKMGAFEVLQRTKDGYFDGNALLSQWNGLNRNHDNRIRIDKFLSLDKTKEFIESLEQDNHGDLLPYGDFKAFIIKKGIVTTKGKTKDEVWMHPYLFIDFAMWINPKFKLAVIKFVYDQLIQQRNDAGNGYKSLSSSLVKLKGYSFQEVAIALQWIVYDKTGKELRQIANQEQLKEINDIQTKLSFAIDMNYIVSYEQLLSEMRKMYNKKYKKF